MTGVCVIPSSGVPSLPVAARCETNAECAGIPGATCETLGTCGTSAMTCTTSLGCPLGTGPCVPFVYTCQHRMKCEPADYGNPALPITVASAGASAILSSLTSRVPEATTPTGPALSGALTYAVLWARQHPERRMALVLATDGLPTDCTPTEIPEIASLAAGAAGAAQPVQTFVIGVFGNNDVELDAPAHLEQIAAAGATSHAWLADTAGDVSRSFENALRANRASAASCGLSLPAEAAQEPDALQLELVDSAGAARVLRRVDSPSGCAGGDAWYYIRDGIGLPARIELCPDVCPVPGSSTHVELLTGCEK